MHVEREARGDSCVPKQVSLYVGIKMAAVQAVTAAYAHLISHLNAPALFASPGCSPVMVLLLCGASDLVLPAWTTYSLHMFKGSDDSKLCCCYGTGYSSAPPLQALLQTLRLDSGRAQGLALHMSRCRGLDADQTQPPLH